MFVEEISSMYVYERGQKRRTQSCGEATEINTSYYLVKKNGEWPLVSLIEPVQLAQLARWANMLENKGVKHYEKLRPRSDRVR
jgi:diaminopimelate epimerase